MTDDEIKKALERCPQHTECCYCNSLEECGNKRILTTSAFDLINRQKAEIERLQKKVNYLKDVNKRNDVHLHVRLVEQAKSEAIKEFAEGFEYFVLNEDPEINDLKCKDYESYMGGVNQFRLQIVKGIDNLVKEMTEVETNQRKEDEGE